MGGGSIRVGSDDLEWPWKAEHEGQMFQADLLNNVRTVWSRTTKFDSMTRVLKSVFLVVTEAGIKRSPILVFISIYAYTLSRRTTYKFPVATHMGRDMF